MLTNTLDIYKDDYCNYKYDFRGVARNFSEGGSKTFKMSAIMVGQQRLKEQISYPFQ